MCDDDCPAEIATADDFQGAKGFAEAHFGVPEDALRCGAVKNFGCHIDRFELFRAEGDRLEGDIGGDARAAAFDGFDGAKCGVEADAEPLARGGIFEVESGEARALEYGVNVAVGKSFSVVGDGELDVQEVVLDGGGASVLIDAAPRGGFHQCSVGVVDGFDGGLADFEQPAMSLIVD